MDLDMTVITSSGLMLAVCLFLECYLWFVRGNTMENINASRVVFATMGRNEPLGDLTTGQIGQRWRVPYGSHPWTTPRPNILFRFW
jgi:hypothetical protein